MWAHQLSWMVTTSLIPKLGLKHHVLDQGGIPIQIHVPTNYRAGCHHFSDQPIQLVRDLVKLSTELIGWGRVSTYAYTVFQSKRVRFSHLGFSISHAEVFGVSFDGPSSSLWPSLGHWTGCFCCLHFHSSFGITMEGRETAQNDLKMIQMPKKIDSDVILT